MKNIILGLAATAMVILLAMKLQQHSIDGQWIAVYVIDNESDTLKIDASAVKLNIEEDRYTFLSTLKQKEAGSIRRNGNHLIVQNDGAQPYKMEISDLTGSDMILTMRVDDKPRKIIMKRQVK